MTSADDSLRPSVSQNALACVGVLSGMAPRVGRAGVIVAATLVAGPRVAVPIVAATALAFLSLSLGRKRDSGPIRDVAEELDALPRHGVVELAAGGDDTCARWDDGEVACWKATSPVASRIARTERSVRLFVGEATACARRPDDSVVCWAHRIIGLSPEVVQPWFRDGLVTLPLAAVAHVASGPHHLCAAARDATVSCMGGNADGQLGNGRLDDSAAMVRAVGIIDVVQVTAGTAHTCARHGDGRVSCWGRNDHGQLGRGIYVDHTFGTSIAGLEDVVSLASSSNHTCGARKDGTVVCWGENHDGQLGDGTKDDRPYPVSVVGLANAAEVATGSQHTCARLHDGRVLCWGGDYSSRPGELTRIRVPAASQLCSGRLHTCALASGDVYCWQVNDREAPRPLPLPTSHPN